MSLATLMTRTATIVRKTQSGATDRYNAPAWSVAGQFNVSCYFEQLASPMAHEDLAGRELQVADYLAVFPTGTGIDASDEVNIGGVTYEVIGEPAVFEQTSTVAHVEVHLRAVSG